MTKSSLCRSPSGKISTHTPLAGRDNCRLLEECKKETFLLTRPLRDVTVPFSFSPRPLSISTHTPLAGRDVTELVVSSNNGGFLLTRPLRDVTAKKC